ncbi:MAG: hypothetical protein U0X58_07860 [Flavobacteriaceae bacterium]
MKIILYTLIIWAALLFKITTAVAQSVPLGVEPPDSLVIANNKIYSIKNLYGLRPTYQQVLDDYFKDNQKLIDCNEQLVKLVKKVKALHEFKYFETNGGFGIISNIKEVKPDENDPTRPKRNWWQKLWGLGGPETTLKRAYVFLIITSQLNEGIKPNYAYLEKTYKNKPLERKWANIASLYTLLNNPVNKFNPQKHSFVLRVYEFKKTKLAKDFQFVDGDDSYVLDTKVSELFGI